MKRLLLIFSFILQFNLFIFSQSKYEKIPEVIFYAINDNYGDFEKYVKSGGNLNVFTENGMNLQISLAYFSEKNFKKACSLLKSKNVNLDEPNNNNFSLLHYLCYSAELKKLKTLLNYKPDIERKSKSQKLSPVQMTQYINYLYYENQPYYYEDDVKKFEIQELLLKKDYYNFKASELTYGYYGNLVLELFNATTVYNPNIIPKNLFSFDLTELRTKYSQEMATITNEKLKGFVNTFIEDAEIYEIKEDIKETLLNCKDSEDDFIILAQTGKSPIAKYQWITIEGFRDENINDNTLLNFSTSDANFGLVEYRLKDISFIILIRKKSKNS